MCVCVSERERERGSKREREREGERERERDKNIQRRQSICVHTIVRDVSLVEGCVFGLGIADQGDLSSHDHGGNPGGNLKSVSHR